MTKPPFDDEQINDKLMQEALRSEKVNHDPAAENRAVFAALRVFDEQKQENTKKAENPFRGFADTLRQLFHGNHEGDAFMNLRKKWMYGVPALATLALFGWVGIEHYSSNPYFNRDEETLGFQAMEKIGGGEQLADGITDSKAERQASIAAPIAPVPSAAPPVAAPMESYAAGAAVNSVAPSVSPMPDGYSNLRREAPTEPEARYDVQGQMRAKIAPGMPAMPYYEAKPAPEEIGQFANAAENNVKLVREEPVSTFSLDVDTASYTLIRRQLSTGQLPPAEAVRVEEMINYFPYGYEAPASREKPFAFTLAVYPTPWNKDTKLLHVGMKSYQAKERPRANITFLIDVSGSMRGPDRLPLLQNALAGFVDSLRAGDTISIVTYAGGTGVLLEPTDVKDAAKIKAALGNLNAGGGTAGAEGLRLAYAQAQKSFDAEATNRVILATDGDFNIGINEPNELQKFIEGKRDSGVFLTILGVGTGNLNDALMQRLAQYGNGTAAYLDSLNEARRVLNDQVSKGMVPVANDAKLQIEFNPSMVSEYRLIGYETRGLKREDFNNDKVDAGDVGEGQEVTAIYEITPAGAKSSKVDPLRYGAAEEKKEAAPVADQKGEYAFVKMRYKRPGEKQSILMEEPVGTSLEVTDVAKLSNDVRFAGAVAGFGQLLRSSQNLGTFGYGDVLDLAKTSLGTDTDGLRQEFLSLVRAAKTASELQNTPGSSNDVEDGGEPRPYPHRYPHRN